MYIIRTDIFEYILSILKLIKTTSMMKIITLVKEKFKNQRYISYNFGCVIKSLKLSKRFIQKFISPFL